MGDPGDIITPLKTTISLQEPYGNVPTQCRWRMTIQRVLVSLCVCVCACVMYLNDCRTSVGRSVGWNEWFGIGVDDVTPSQYRLCLARLAWMPPTRSSAIGRRSLTPRSKDQQEFLGITCRLHKLHLLICFTLPHWPPSLVFGRPLSSQSKYVCKKVTYVSQTKHKSQTHIFGSSNWPITMWLTVKQTSHKHWNYMRQGWKNLIGFIRLNRFIWFFQHSWQS